MSILGNICFMTLEPGAGTNEEQICFTGINQNTNGTATLTGVSNVSFESPYTQTSGLAKTHAGSTIAIISNTSGFYDELTGKADDEIIAGDWTFTNFAPTIPTETSLDIHRAASIEYVNNIAIAGAPDATTIVKGITKMSVAPVSPTSPIAVGDNDPRVPTQGENNALVGNNTDIAVGTGNKFVTQTGLQHNAEKYAADAQANDTYVITLSPIPTSYTTGMIVYFKANTTNTGAATINVNSLGAKTIVKIVNTTLADGDIAAGQFCTLIYDGTNFVLQNPVANAPVSYTNGVTTRAGQTAGGTQTIAHGLGKIPKNVRISTMWISPGNAFGPIASSNGTYNGTTQGCVYVYTITGSAGTSSAAGNDSSHIILLRAALNTADVGQQAVCTVDATNITLTWSFYGSGSGMSTTNDINILWEAEG